MSSTLYFIHIPKCAGNGIVTILSSLGVPWNILCSYECIYSLHKDIFSLTDPPALKKSKKFADCPNAREKISKIENTINLLTHHVFPKKKTKNDFIISSIRNPYAWLVSRWAYYIRSNPGSYTFKEWVDNFGGEYLMRFIECCYEEGDVKKDLIIDYFIRVEDINAGIHDLLEKKLIETTIPHQKINKLCEVKVNSTHHSHYEDYYTEELKEKVYNKNKLIFDLFGYE